MSHATACLALARASMKASLRDEWGRSLWNSCQWLPVCLETKTLERIQGFLGVKLLCRFLKCLGRLCSPGSFPFPPSGSCQGMVGVSGPGPEQKDRRRECAGMAAMFGLWSQGAAQACHCSTPSALHSGKQEGLGKAERLALGSGQRLRAPSKDCSTVSQHSYREPRVGKAPSAPPHP